MSAAAIWANLPLALAALIAMAGAVQAGFAGRFGLRLFGLAALFFAAAVAFALAGGPGVDSPASDPAAQAAAIVVLLLGLALLGFGAALSIRLRERFGGLNDDAALATAEADEPL